jgi:hypothetical protein
MLSSKLKDAIRKAYNGKCQYCGQTDANHVDHIVPKCRGGSDELSNLTLACERCNLMKSSHIISDGFIEILKAIATSKHEQIATILLHNTRRMQVDQNLKDRKQYENIEFSEFMKNNAFKLVVAKRYSIQRRELFRLFLRENDNYIEMPITEPMFWKLRRSGATIGVSSGNDCYDLYFINPDHIPLRLMRHPSDESGRRFIEAVRALGADH